MLHRSLLCLSLAIALVAHAAAPAQTAPGGASPPRSEVAADAPQALDRAFARHALQAGLAEVAYGSLAEQRAHDPAVNRFGARMVEDHGGANVQLLSLARSAGLGSLRSTLGPQQQGELQRLTGLRGDAFDQAFLGLMIQDHRQAIERYERYAESGHSVLLKAFALRNLPTLRSHLQSAEATHVAVNHVRPARIDPERSVAKGLDRRASKLIGMEVLGDGGTPIGTLEDLVLDVREGVVDYAVLSFGGFMGLGDRLFAFPLRRFRLSLDGQRLLLPEVSAEKLKHAPGFEPGRWPDWNDPGLQSTIARFHGVAPTRPGRERMRASELVGRDVNDASGQAAGEVEDAVVNLATARVHFLVLEYDPGWLSRERLLPLPVSAVHFPDDPRSDLVLALPREELAGRSGFDDGRWPDLNSPGFQRSIEATLQDSMPPGAR